MGKWSQEWQQTEGSTPERIHPVAAPQREKGGKSGRVAETSSARSLWNGIDHAMAVQKGHAPIPAATGWKGGTKGKGPGKDRPVPNTSSEMEGITDRRFEGFVKSFNYM